MTPKPLPGGDPRLPMNRQGLRDRWRGFRQSFRIEDRTRRIGEPLPISDDVTTVSRSQAVNDLMRAHDALYYPSVPVPRAGLAQMLKGFMRKGGKR